jgi:hypothetical protein
LSEGIGSALKGGAKVCQHQLVNEVLRLLVTEFVINFGRKDATPIQRAFQSGLLSRTQAVKLIIRHSTLPDISQPPDSGWSPIQRTRFTLAELAAGPAENRGDKIHRDQDSSATER